jgi:hypothetical protein
MKLNNCLPLKCIGIFILLFFVNSCSMDEVNISINKENSSQVLATISGKTYGDIDWIWSPDSSFIECYVFVSGPSKLIWLPSVFNRSGSQVSINRNFVRARIDKSGTGDYVYSNIIGPL